MNLNTHHFVVALVFDLPQDLNITEDMPFPHDSAAEWESRETISTIEKTWSSLGYKVIQIPLDKNFMMRWTNLRRDISLVHSLVEGWGSTAREGWLPSLCELSGVAYIGSGPTAMNVAMRKTITKMICRQNGIRTPNWFYISCLEDLNAVDGEFLQAMHFVKPDAEGSGMGIDAGHSLSNSREQTVRVCEELLKKYADGVLLEEYIDGPEYTSALLGTPMEHLPIAQIEVDDGVYGLSNKSKEIMGERVSFPVLDENMKCEIETWGQRLSKILGFQDFVRYDWKAKKDGTVYFLEANPLAGLSYYYSVLPKMAYEAGYTYASLLQKLADGAARRQSDRKYWYGRSRIS